MTAEQDAMRSPRVAPAIFVKFDLEDGPVRVWSGVNNRRGGPGDEALSGGLMPLYVGRRLMNFPALTRLNNAKADRVQLVLSGADSAIADLLDSRAAEVRGAEVIVSYAVMSGAVKHPDVSWPVWRMVYLADTPGFQFDGKGKLQVVIGAATAFARRKNPANQFWTHADQLRRYPGDMALEHINDLNEGVQKLFRGT